MKKILIIDFSIIFPSMFLYDQFILKKEKNISEIFGLKELNPFDFDAHTYKILTEYIISCYNNNIPCFFIDSIEDFMSIKQTENLDIINISHHSHVTKYDDYFLNNLNFYLRLWVKNGTSNIENMNKYNQYKDIFYNFNPYDINDVEEIYICSSKELCSPQYTELFNLWKDLYKKRTY